MTAADQEKEQGGVMASAADGGGKSDEGTGTGPGDGSEGPGPGDGSERPGAGAGEGSGGPGGGAGAPDGGDGAAKPPLRTSVWQTDQKAARARHRRSTLAATLDRTKIVAAAVRLLDTEGPAKFSMRRLAAELDVTAMSVYWYVDNKEDLLEYALDAVYGELPLPDVSDPARWREQLRALSLAYRTLLVRHPWTSALVGHFLNIGPNSVSFVLAAQQAVQNSGLPLRGQLGGMAAVFQFVYGFGTIEGQSMVRSAAAGMTEDEAIAGAMRTVGELPELAEYVAVSTEMLDARGGSTIADMRNRDFDFALDLLIAGIERMAERAGDESADPSGE
ncbi:TetR/AcrR family transcriptional regulator C-terminal domain-containing protein [Streptomyces sp. NPDC006798]|uniref:TetR/AcrR family transcriptional regulator n=1 Tax=Streptomyces sp. NPDC006798 TaxID=3155462 RepID=UPI0033EE6A75